MLPKKSSMLKIAEKANVSTMTVSRVLNNSGAVAPATRELVLKIAREEGYHHYPNALSRMLRGERSHSIGVLACFARPNLIGEVICRIGRELFPTNYLNYIIDTYADPEVTLQSLKNLAERRTEGVIYFASSAREINGEIAGLLGQIGSSVIVSNEKHDLPIQQIYCGWAPGVEQIIRYFKSKGCRCPVLLKESANTACLCEFERACKENGFSRWEVVTCPAEKLPVAPEFRNGFPGDALFASSERYHPILEKMTDCGQKIPLVMLMDDFLIHHVRPAYPVLRRREPEAGVLAVKLLFDQINMSGEFHPGIADLPMEFIEHI